MKSFKELSKKEITQICLMTLSCVIIIFGLLFVLTSAELAPVFPAFYNIGNILGRYVIVLVTMITGIMLFSNVALTIENKKWRNGLTIGITAFATVLTVPLVYVFIAIFPAHNGILGPVGEIMMLGRIVDGFTALFGAGDGIYALYAVLLLVSIIFICEPLIAGILAVKGKSIKIGKTSKGKFGVEIVELPVLAKQRAASSGEEKTCCGCACEQCACPAPAADED